MKLEIGKTTKGIAFSLDLSKLITERTLICSVSRYGKSWTARLITEKLFGKTGIVILDPEGEYSSLREKYPFLIIGRDIPLVPEAAEFLAEQVLKEGLSVIIDTSDPDLEISTGQEFVSSFVNYFIRLETKIRKAYLFIIEEADEFAPERGTFKSISLGAMIKIAKKGGKRGIGVMFLTQRPAFVSKYCISQCTNKMIGRIEWPDDITVLRKFATIPEKITDKLKELQKGEFFVTGTFCDNTDFVKIGKVQTTHLGETPEVIPPTPSELKALVQRLSESLPKIVEKQLKPAVPDIKIIEDRIKEKFEREFQVKLARQQKDSGKFEQKLKDKFEGKIKSLEIELEKARKQIGLKVGFEPTEDLFENPLIKGRLQQKLSENQISIIQYIHSKGGATLQELAGFLGMHPKSIQNLIGKTNHRMPKLIIRRNRTDPKYYSGLAEIFPMAKQQQIKMEEVTKLQKELKENRSVINQLQKQMESPIKERLIFKKKYDELFSQSKQLEKKYNSLQNVLIKIASLTKLLKDKEWIEPEKLFKTTGIGYTIEVPATASTTGKTDMYTDSESSSTLSYGKSNLRNHPFIKPLVDSLPPYAQKMFEFLDKYADSQIGFTRFQVASGAGISSKSSYVGVGIKMLKDAKLIEELSDGKLRSIAYKLMS